MSQKPNRVFFFTVLGLSLFGFFIFTSASLGLISRSGASFNLVALKQLVVLVAGLIIFILVSKVNYHFWRDHSLLIFIFTIILTLLVFVPGIGITSGGAQRWIRLFSFSIQPAELLKFGFIIYTASYLAKFKDQITNPKKGLVPLLAISAVVGIIMAAQPDLDTLVIMLVAGVAMFFVSGAPWKQIILIGFLAIIGLGAVAVYKPYVIDRVKTFFDPTADILGSGYQVDQSLIAIGSGGLTGRGFGQSIQKFQYLPEPIGDSIFSVASEEFGFIGATIIIALFLIFAFAGLRVAVRAPDRLGRLVAVGIVIMIITGTFINIASMLGIIPLAGTLLVFVSHGGTALLVTLFQAGIILNISRHAIRS